MTIKRIVFARGRRGGAIGYSGAVSFVITPTAMAGAWAEYLDGWAAPLCMLALYSFFCGVSRHTSIGLGQTPPRLAGVETGMNG